MKATRPFVKALILLVLLFAITTVAAAAVSAWQLDRSLTAEYESKGMSIAQSIAASSVDVLPDAEGDASKIQAAIDEYVDIKGVSYAFVVDSHGEIIAHTFAPSVPRELRHLSGDPHETTTQDVHVDGLGDFIDVAAPVLEGEAGYVHVGMDRMLIKTSITGAVQQQTLVMCLLFPLGAWAAYFLMRTEQAEKDTADHRL